MSKDLFLTKVTLRRDAPMAAMRSVFLPEGDEQRTVVGHRLMWTLFADTPDRERDFLWRDAGDGRYYVLSERPPHDRHEVFHVDPPKEFAPALRAGDRLRFTLRANATVARRAEGSKRGKPSDVVMDALYKIERGPDRALARGTVVRTAGLEWLSRQGERCGFSIPIPMDEKSERPSDAVRVMGYQAIHLDHGKERMTIGVLDFEGEMTVTVPDALIAAIGNGFGRAKAFGCGLMLIRRA